MARHNNTGKEGEAQAVIYLQEDGYRILHTNWRVGHYELDIVAEKEGELVIVEVKTRTSLEFEIPADAVGKGKIRRIVSAADKYMQLYDIDLPVRFDIISIYKSESEYKIDHIEDAFYPPVM